MRNPYEQEVENRRVRGCCPKCHTPFHERVHRVVSFERVVCLSCRNEMRIHGIGHIHEHESVQALSTTWKNALAALTFPCATDGAT